MFGRPESFDPRVDSVVRVYATHVRKRLRAYYGTRGRSDPIKIDLPAGTYAPLITLATNDAIAAASQSRRELFEMGVSLSPTIGVFPSLSLSAGEDYMFCDGIADELISALAGMEDIRVLPASYTVAFRQRLLELSSASSLGITAFFEITARRREGRVRVIARLFNVHTCRFTWMGRFDSELEDVFATQEHIANAIAAAFSAELKRGTTGLRSD